MNPQDKQWEEQGLRAAVLAGNELAWRTLYDRHFDPLFAYVYARTRDPHRTEDLVQEAWTTAVRRIAAFDAARGPFGAWLRGIADRLLINDRRRWARRFRLRQEVGESTTPEPAVPQPGAGEAVDEALAALPERYREVLRAKYEESHTVAEIARARGLSEKAVESLLTRARQAFRAAWTRPGSRDA